MYRIIVFLSFFVAVEVFSTSSHIKTGTTVNSSRNKRTTSIPGKLVINVGSDGNVLLEDNANSSDLIATSDKKDEVKKIHTKKKIVRFPHTDSAKKEMLLQKKIKPEEIIAPKAREVDETKSTPWLLLGLVVFVIIGTVVFLKSVPDSA